MRPRCANHPTSPSTTATGPPGPLPVHTSPPRTNPHQPNRTTSPPPPATSRRIRPTPDQPTLACRSNPPAPSPLSTAAASIRSPSTSLTRQRWSPPVTSAPPAARRPRPLQLLPLRDPLLKARNGEHCERLAVAAQPDQSLAPLKAALPSDLAPGDPVDVVECLQRRSSTQPREPVLDAPPSPWTTTTGSDVLLASPAAIPLTSTVRAAPCHLGWPAPQGTSPSSR